MTETTASPAAVPAPTQPTKYEQLRVIPWSLGYDLTNTFFVQLTFFGSVFILFLNDLGLDKSQIGLLLSTLPFLSLLSLFITPPVTKFGYRKTFLISIAVRNLFTAGLLLTPLIAVRLGTGAVVKYVAFITIAFAISRAVAMTAFLPWQQEYIPSSIRGRISGYSSIIISLAGLVAVAIAGFLIDRPFGPWRYPVLFGIGVVFGIASIVISGRFPGGRALPGEAPLFKIDRRVLEPLRDSRFVRYLLILGLVTLAIGPIFSFLPIFMKEKVGLNSGSIVLLQTGSMIGSLLSSYFWGWLADRYGSKPISMTGLLMTAVLPVLWFIMPRGSSLSFPVALAISFLQGIASTGWSIGSGRMLFVSIVTGENKAEYLSQYNAWTGLLSGIGSILGGVLLQSFSTLRTTVANLPIDAYAILFALGVLTSIVCALLLYTLATHQEAGLVEFAGLFFHGNPLMAISSMIRFYNAREEAQVLKATQGLGVARSPLTVDELIGSLQDPRFYVRFEAIVSMTHHAPDEQLVRALVAVMEAPDPALGTVATWALARMASPDAIPALRETLRTSRFRSVQIQAARALARLGDRDVVPWLKEHIHDSADLGIEVASASGLGRLQVRDAVPDILALLHSASEVGIRRELGLALARMLGAEGKYIQLTRAAEEDAGTALALEMEALRSRLKRAYIERYGISNRLVDARDKFAAGALSEGFEVLVRVLELLSAAAWPRYCLQMVAECRERIRDYGPARLEYAIIAIIALERCGTR